MPIAAENKSKGLIAGPFLCIVNPNSGTGASERFIRDMQKRSSEPKLDIQVSQSPDHSTKLARSAGEKGYKGVIAVGGDGSVHEIAAQLIGTDIALGIVPTGSGNGVARHLGISIDPERALEEMMRGKSRAIDTLLVNGRPSIGFAGVGIDGLVAKLFDEAEERGLSNYVKLSLDTFLKYRATNFSIRTREGKETSLDALTVICANTSQLGNNAVMNATGEDDDGILELVIVKSVPSINMMPLASRLFLRSLHKSPFVKVLQSTGYTIKNHGKAMLQIDGEKAGSPSDIDLEIKPRSLHVLIP